MTTGEMDRLLKAVNEVEHLLCEDAELLAEALRALRLCASKLRIHDEGEHLPPSAEQEAANEAIFNIEERLLNE